MKKLILITTLTVFIVQPIKCFSWSWKKITLATSAIAAGLFYAYYKGYCCQNNQLDNSKQNNNNKITAISTTETTKNDKKEQSDLIEKKEEKSELEPFDFSTLNITTIETKTGLDLSKWQLKECEITDGQKKTLYFFDSKVVFKEKDSVALNIDKAFGYITYMYVPNNARKDKQPAHIEIPMIHINNEYRGQSLFKIVVPVIIDYFIKKYDDFKYINFDITQPWFEKVDRSKEEHEKGLMRLYMLVGVDVDKIKQTGMISRKKIDETMRQYTSYSKKFN